MCECNMCGKPATITSPDPFMSDVFMEDGPYPNEDWCEDCFEGRCDDV